MGPGLPSRACFFGGRHAPATPPARKADHDSMMGSDNGNITIGHVWGIPIQINPSLFLILALVTWTLASPEGLLPGAYPELSDWPLVDGAAHRAPLFRLDPVPRAGSRLGGETQRDPRAQRHPLYLRRHRADWRQAENAWRGISPRGGRPASSLVLAAIFYGLNQVFAQSRLFRRIIGMAGLHQPHPGTVQSAAWLSS